MDHKDDEIEPDRFAQLLSKKIEHEKNVSNKPGTWSFVFYMTVFVVIGVPVWYHTTTTERWPLPDVSWLMVKSQTLKQYYLIDVVLFEANHKNLDMSQIRELAKFHFSTRNSFGGGLSFVNNWNIRNPTPSELDSMHALINDKNQEASHIVEKLDESLFKHSGSSVTFYILPKSIQTVQSSFLTAGKYKSYYINLNNLTKSDPSDDLNMQLISKINHQLEFIQKTVEYVYTQLSNENDQEISLLLSKDFDLIFDIIYENDHLLGSQDVQLPLDYASFHASRHAQLLNHIRPLINKFRSYKFNFEKYFQVNFLTQVLHSVFFDEHFIASHLVESNDNQTSRWLPVSAVQSILNQIESRRVEYDNEKSYRLVLYVTSSQLPPLKFVQDNESKASSSLIMTPHRGSILIINQDELDLKRGFHQFIRSFYRLDSEVNSFINHQIPYDYFTQSEIESVIRALVQKHILKTLKSLESTESLLKTVSNMVIQEGIAQRMQQAVQDSMEAAGLLSSSDDLIRAYDLSFNAFNCSESAFYDPSLLSLLYFPEDQKYAIYIPLFFPVFLPLLGSVKYFVLKAYKSKR